MGASASVIEIPDHVDANNIESLMTQLTEEQKVKCQVVFENNKDANGNIDKLKALLLVDNNLPYCNHVILETAIIAEKTVNDANVTLISYDHFKSHGSFPKYPDHGFLTTTLDKVDKSNAFIIFVSHTWNHSHSLNVFEAPPHKSVSHEAHVKPDNDRNDRYILCVDGIEKLLAAFASDFTQCYLFVDYSCVDQSTEHPSASLKHLDSIMLCCDCLFTPIFNEDSNWELPTNITNYYEDYDTPQWNGSKTDAYLNRAWCRLEMFYSSTISLYPHPDTEARLNKMKGRLAFHIKNGNRPHVVYTSYEQRVSLPPIVIPPLNSSFYEKYNPELGYYSHKEDRVIIKNLWNKLKSFAIDSVRLGYEGELDETGAYHGQGTYRYDNGDVYIGEWKHGKKDGVGRFTYGEGGEVYEGEYCGDHQKGLCKMRYQDGSMYCGERRHHRNEGMGLMEYANGDVYDGMFHKNHREGHGKLKYANGDTFEGEFKHDHRHGVGTYTFADGRIMKGEWKQDKHIEK